MWDTRDEEKSNLIPKVLYWTFGRMRLLSSEVGEREAGRQGGQV